MKVEAMILNTSDDAATFVTGLSGWVDRHGQFFGADERTARWSGATHLLCSECQIPTPKNYTRCDSCRARTATAKYEARPHKAWKDEPLYSETADRWFFSDDELQEYCDTYETTAANLRLIVCDPVYATEIDPNEYYLDELPEDGEVDGDLADAFAALNAVIRAKQKPLSWRPGEYAADLLEPTA